MTIKLGDIRLHVEDLCRRYKIIWIKRSRRAFALPEVDEIDTPPIRGAVSYGVALHEIGHILGRFQDSRHVTTRETWAWRWARENALIWSPAMERCAAASLAWYAPRAAKIDARRALDMERRPDIAS